MPIEVIKEGRLHCFRFYGDVSSEETRKTLFDSQGGSDFDMIKFSIVDFSEAKSLNISEEDVKEFAAMAIGAKMTNPSIKVALVAILPEIRKILELYAKLSPRNPKVFESLESARSWING